MAYGRGYFVSRVRSNVFLSQKMQLHVLCEKAECAGTCDAKRCNGSELPWLCRESPLLESYKSLRHGVRHFFSA